MARRDWNPLPGVDPGTWDYLDSHWIADRYQDYFADHPLFEVDQAILLKAFGSPELEQQDPVEQDSEQQDSGKQVPEQQVAGKRIVDLGCGNGRALLPLIQRGFRGLAVDLSWAMLQAVRQAADRQGLPVTCVQANLVQLDGLTDASCDHGMCLFSTLGMIQGRENRVAALRHFRRIIRPGGTLVLHVHNYWYNLSDPGGPWWLLKNLFQSLFSSRVELGDKWYPYRGIPNMFLHVFRQTEIQSDLIQSGWTDLEFIPLQPVTLRPWSEAAIGKSWRAIGWIILCRGPRHGPPSP